MDQFLGHKVFITSDNNKARICGLELIKALSNPKKKPDGLECDLDGFVKGCINILTATKVQPSLAGKIVSFFYSHIYGNLKTNLSYFLSFSERYIRCFGSEL